MMSAVQWELTLQRGPAVPGNLLQAYGMLLVQISWGFSAVPADLELTIGSTKCSVSSVLQRCPILQVRT
jgi:hypothetical protein